MDKLLTLEELQKNLIDWKEFGKEEALVTLIQKNEGLIKFFANKYQGKGVPFDDLVSAGKEGLLKAISKIDYKEFTTRTFSTYASIYIKGYMKNELTKQQKHNYVLSFEQMIEIKGEQIKIEDLISNELIGIEDYTMLLPDQILINKILKVLNPKEREVISLRVGINEEYGKTLREIAEILGCTYQNVSRYEQKALKKLREPQNLKKIKTLIEK